jgi:hypothetical protein
MLVHVLLPKSTQKKTYEIKNAVAVVFKVVGIFLHINKKGVLNKEKQSTD